MIIIDWPTAQEYGKHYENIVKIYERAAKANYKSIKEKNDKIRDAFINGTEFCIKDSNGMNLNLKKYGNSVLCEDYLTKINIIQIPSGEVFFPVDFLNCNGLINVNSNNNPILLEVDKGEVDFNKISKKIGRCVICEFGLGTNPKMPMIKMIPTCEKAWRSCHIGFGNNISFGGNLNLQYHFDLVISNFELFIDNQKWDFF